MKYESPTATAYAHTSDATFRTWMQEFETAVLGTGLVRTTDTGQIDMTTALRPAVNTYAGQAIYKFTDALQATAPIVIKVEFGTGTAATTPSIRITVATGTDGAGGMAGIAIKTATYNPRGNSTPGAGLYKSYACFVSGCFWIVFKYGSLAAASSFAFQVCRTSDNDGTPNGEGCTLISAANSPSAGTEADVQPLRFASPATVYSSYLNRYATTIFGNVISSLVGIDVQIYLWFTINPRAQPIHGVLSYIIVDIASLADFQATVVGTADRHYLALQQVFGAAGLTTGGGQALLWE